MPPDLNDDLPAGRRRAVGANLWDSTTVWDCRTSVLPTWLAGNTRKGRSHGLPRGAAMMMHRGYWVYHRGSSWSAAKFGSDSEEQLIDEIHTGASERNILGGNGIPAARWCERLPRGLKRPDFRRSRAATPMPVSKSPPTAPNFEHKLTYPDLMLACAAAVASLTSLLPPA